MNLQAQKDELVDDILSSLSAVDDVVSVTLVGSFIDRPDMSGISDIDTVVICRNLTKTIFDACIEICNSIDVGRHGLSEHKIFVNTSFGPLKFNTGNLVVIHLMVYDIDGHINHVIKSPFTCYDWERSTEYRGWALRDICPVGQLQLVDFMVGRRSAKEYLSELDSGKLSYREYEWKNDGVKEAVREQALDDRGKGEFAYHIVRNILVNFFKFEKKVNALPSDQDMAALAVRIVPGPEIFLCKLKEITSIKRDSDASFPDDVVSWAMDFLECFNCFIGSYAESSRWAVFFRHAKSTFNDGSYLGVRRDPPIVPGTELSIEEKFDFVFSSPMLRAKQTARLISKTGDIELDENLKEIDYGQVEGLNFEVLTIHYPDIVRSWGRRGDPNFPAGESTQNVASRLEDFTNRLICFLATMPELQRIGVVTHNVVMRCLIGKAFDLPLWCWFHIEVDHLTRHEFIIENAQVSPNIDRSLLVNAYQALSENI